MIDLGSACGFATEDWDDRGGMFKLKLRFAAQAEGNSKLNQLKEQTMGMTVAALMEVPFGYPAEMCKLIEECMRP